MNIFVFLLGGLLIGYILRRTGKRVKVDTAISVALLLMIFFLGVKTGTVKVSALWLLASSLVFAVLTILGSLVLALGVRT
ncbi:hypothetical membrane protein, conserved [Thermococcus kodakarensis KOD1]|uniref:Hypothetical membrane protein, conserved n=1 Tax=Thermococcus kodakarensis (strain ATCC BAA-918 / JCM 12380 / KOD1) TaxID=69014 RepID=Q5JE54_THEKO|nr:hypothetical protein [Thermococcus kodakarensis]WCN29049.1 hypothetical protein POG15_05545 [Thermococcus kodakarensis]WCN31354.1 hypothetical protein POG21_05545 [Thermococcus kodakarensis]BAD85284.1 hypothetical membrane protein, conserved [Thermococcus kodakarensis KOD1]